MSLRKLHNNISTIYHFIFNDPNLYNLINKIDSLSIDELGKLVSYNIVQNINYDIIIEKVNLIENKNNIEFCNIIEDCIKNNLIYMNKNIFDEVLICYQNIFNNIYKYYIIGFFFESYIEKYNKIISKIKNVTLLEDNLLLKNKKDEIYKLLIKDFLLELVSNFLHNILKIFQTSLPINSNNNLINSSTKIFEEITINLDKLIDIYHLHNNNIDELLSS